MERGWPVEHSGHVRASADIEWTLTRELTASDAGRRVLGGFDYSAAQRSRTFTMATALRLATTTEEIRASVQRFNDEAKTWAYARQLAKATVYWVCDEKTGTFGPSKFVAFAGITADGYDEARKHNATGAYFDGHATRKAIERVVGQVYESNETMAGRLVQWGNRVFVEGVFAGSDRSKWKFVVVR